MSFIELETIKRRQMYNFILFQTVHFNNIEKD